MSNVPKLDRVYITRAPSWSHKNSPVYSILSRHYGESVDTWLSSVLSRNMPASKFGWLGSNTWSYFIECEAADG